MKAEQHHGNVSKPLAFSIQTCTHNKFIVNFPINKPQLVCLLEENQDNEIGWSFDRFIFFPKNAIVSVDNPVKGTSHTVLSITFEEKDFTCFRSMQRANTASRFDGKFDAKLKQILYQFIRSSEVTQAQTWSIYRQEILQQLYRLGYEQVSTFGQIDSLGHLLYNLISEDLTKSWSGDELSSVLSMSNSTLRRKLKNEGHSLREIKDNAKFGYGLYLVRTTSMPISKIAEQCGYESQSRFTDKFKKLFGLCPTALRETDKKRNTMNRTY